MKLSDNLFIYCLQAATVRQKTTYKSALNWKNSREHGINPRIAFYNSLHLIQSPFGLTGSLDLSQSEVWYTVSTLLVHREPITHLMRAGSVWCLSVHSRYYIGYGVTSLTPIQSDQRLWGVMCQVSSRCGRGTVPTRTTTRQGLRRELRLTCILRKKKNECFNTMIKFVYI